MSVEGGSLVVRKCTRVLSKRRVLVYLRRLLDRGPILLPVSADAELDAVSIES